MTKIGSFWAKGPCRGARVCMERVPLSTCTRPYDPTMPFCVHVDIVQVLSGNTAGCSRTGSLAQPAPGARTSVHQNDGGTDLTCLWQATCHRNTPLHSITGAALCAHGALSRSLTLATHAPAGTEGGDARGVEGTHLHCPTASKKERTAASRIPTWSPTAVLTRRYHA